MNTPEDVEDKVLSIVSFQLGARKEDLSRAVFIEDLGADALDHVELIMAIAEEFCICVYGGEDEQINTVGDLIDLVKSKVEYKDVHG